MGWSVAKLHFYVIVWFFSPTLHIYELPKEVKYNEVYFSVKYQYSKYKNLVLNITPEINMQHLRLIKRGNNFFKRWVCLKDKLLVCVLQLQRLKAFGIKFKMQYNWISTIVISTIVVILYDWGVKVPFKP